MDPNTGKLFWTDEVLQFADVCEEQLSKEEMQRRVDSKELIEVPQMVVKDVVRRGAGKTRGERIATLKAARRKAEKLARAARRHNRR